MGMPFPTAENLFIHCGVVGATGGVFATTTAGEGSAVALDLLTRAFQSFDVDVDVDVVVVVVVVDADTPDSDGSTGMDGSMGAPAPTGPFRNCFIQLGVVGAVGGRS